MDFVNSALLKTGGLPLVDSWNVVTTPNIVGAKYYDGYVYACGDNRTNISGGDCYVYKFNLNGEVVWQKKQYLGSRTHNKGIAVNSSGVFVITTFEDYGSSGSTLLKYDHDGVLLSTLYMRLGTATTSLVCIDASESSVVVGGYSGGDAIVVSFDNSLNINWQKKYAKTGNDYIYGLCIDPDDSDTIYIAGKTVSTLFGVGGNAGLFMVLDSSGVIQLQKQWSSGGGLNVDFKSVHVTTTVDGTFGFICGYQDDGSGSYSGVVHSCDQTGFTSLYYRYWDAPNSVKFNSVKTVRDGASGVPRIVGTYGTTSAFTLKIRDSISGLYYFTGKKFTNTYFGNGIELVGSDTFSCYANGYLDGALVRMTDAVLSDAVDSTWGQATVTNIDTLPTIWSADYGSVGMTESVISLTTSTESTITDKVDTHPSNYNYSNKAV